MTSRLDSIRSDRLGKLKRLRELGVDPYPTVSNRTHNIEDARGEMGKSVTVSGRIRSLRTHGKLAFADLEDETGKIQLFLTNDDLGKQEYELVELLDVGDFLEAKGEVMKTKAGEISVRSKRIKLLSKSVRPLPDEWYGFKDLEERYRQRYVDLLVNEEVKKVFLLRTQIVRELRKFLDKHGFVEVETPILQPVYGGASAQPFVTHHNALGTDLFLRISDELYLKRLIAGGFEKVYEIGKDFRNEGISPQHNPEFTQLEFYWAYSDYEELMRFSEKMISEVLTKTLGSLKIKHEDTEFNFEPPFKRITFRDLVLRETEIDIDKADTEEKLLNAIKEKGIELDLKGIAGYGALVDKLYKETSRQTIEQPTFLTDYPSEMISLAKRKEDNPKKIASFQLLVKGFEVIKAYNELNDPVDQRERWEEEEKLAEEGLEDHMVVDEDYLRALEYGMPPTAGWGMGIDRFVALVTNQPSLKDVILFPTLRPENNS